MKPVADRHLKLHGLILVTALTGLSSVMDRPAVGTERPTTPSLSPKVISVPVDVQAIRPPRITAPSHAAGDGDQRTASPERSSLVAAIDPETGLLGPPTAEQVRAIARATPLALDGAPADPLEMHRADGAVGIDLSGRLRDYAVVRIGPDDKPAFGCLHLDQPHRRTLADSLAKSPAAEDR